MSGERETLDIDVVFVGAGPASLAGAYHLAGLVRRHPIGFTMPISPWRPRSISTPTPWTAPSWSSCAGRAA